MSLHRKGSALGRLAVKRGTSISTSETTRADDENFNSLRLRDISEMVYRPEYVVRWLWYAFNALDDQTVGRLSKMQLKMLTAHLGSARMAKQTVLMMTSANDLLNDALHEQTDTMNFEEYSNFLSKNKFLDAAKLDLRKLEEACWMLCNKTFMARTPKLPSVSNTALYQLWRLFNLYSEPESLPPYLEAEEALCLTEKLLVAMGTKFEREKFEIVCQTLGDKITLLDYLRCLETQYLPDLDEMCVSEGIACVHRTLVEEQEKVGFLKKKGHNFTTWRERWFVLKLGSLAYYVSSDMKDQKGEIDLKAKWKVEVLADIKGLKNLFILHRDGEDGDPTKEKVRYELQAPDPLVRQEWITALKYVIKRSNGIEESDHWKEFKRRYDARGEKRRMAEEAEKKRKEDEEEKERQRQAMEDLQKAHEEAEKKAKAEEELRKAKEIEEAENRQREQEHREKTQKELEKLMAAHEDALRMAREEAEKRERKELEEQQRRKLEEEEKEKMLKEFAELQAALQDAEKRAAIEAALKEANQARQEELEESLTLLEGLLEEEKQAKRDEEIVRGLQARLLEEETEKREELEKLRVEQERMLEEEQEKRQHLEQVSEELQTERLEQQRLLEKERKRLEQLEKDRKSADEQLQEAIEKLVLAEQKKREEERRKLELQRPVGLARLIQPKANPLKSHRGVGAFTESQFEVIKQLRRQWKDRSILTPGNDLSPSPEHHPAGGKLSDDSSEDGSARVDTNGQLEEEEKTVDNMGATKSLDEQSNLTEPSVSNGDAVTNGEDVSPADETCNGPSSDVDGEEEGAPRGQLISGEA